MSDDLSIWCIYEKPRDFPHCFVARRFLVARGTGFDPIPTHDVVVGPSLERVREGLAMRYPGLVRMPRHEDDEPQIVETWI